jgi:DNA-binding ferritin-like protein
MEDKYMDKMSGDYNVMCGDMIQPVLVKLVMLNTKCHTLHWMVVGDMFIEAHDILQQIYNWAHRTLDEAGEALRKMEQIPDLESEHVFRDYAGPEKSAELREYLARDAYMAVLPDLEYLREDFQMIFAKGQMWNIAAAYELGEEALEFLDKIIWFLKSILKGPGA